jgi:pyridoxal biosynthesis lyase PdxS
VVQLINRFAAGGVATPADAALMMQLGCDGVFVGSGICELICAGSFDDR